ncbi:MAG: PEP-CTERM sorting domain-containing protein [Planctomycetes bacterium]|nr:PEP-CTERM sorting domain-containing protein [Planctomycetota bacterium]
MDNHSRKLCVWGEWCITILIWQTAALGAEYFSFGKSVNESFGPDYIKSWVNIDIFVPIHGTILDIDIALNIEHTSFCDLQISIGNPDLGGDTILINYYDDIEKNHFDPNRQIPGWIILDEESMFDIDQSWEPYMGLFKPNGEDKLSSFYGQQSYGLWQIQICDAIFYDTGTVKGIRLDMLIDTNLEPAGVLSIPEPATFLLAAIGAAFVFKSRHST